MFGIDAAVPPEADGNFAVRLVFAAALVQGRPGNFDPGDIIKRAAELADAFVADARRRREDEGRRESLLEQARKNAPMSKAVRAVDARVTALRDELGGLEMKWNEAQSRPAKQRKALEEKLRSRRTEIEAEIAELEGTTRRKALDVATKEGFATLVAGRAGP